MKSLKPKALFYDAMYRKCNPLTHAGRRGRLLLLPLFAVMLSGVMLAVLLPTFWYGVFYNLQLVTRLSGNMHIILCGGQLPADAITNSTNGSTAPTSTVTSPLTAGSMGVGVAVRLSKQSVADSVRKNAEAAAFMYGDVVPNTQAYQPLSQVCQEYLQHASNLLEVWTKVTDVDTTALTITLRVTRVAAHGALKIIEGGSAAHPGPTDLINLKKGEKLHLSIADVTQEYDAESLLSNSLTGFEAQSFMWSQQGFGNFMYPFDRYDSSFKVRAAISSAGPKGKNVTDSTLILRPVTVVWYVDTGSSQFTIVPADVAEQAISSRARPVPVQSSAMTGSVTSLHLPVVVSRHLLVRCTSMFIVVLMWLLASFMLVAAIDFTIVRPREDRDEATATAVALLFALPGLRAVQPGVPDVVGSLIDVCGFYWNMVMVSVAALLFLAKFVGDYSRRPGRQNSVSASESDVEADCR